MEKQRRGWSASVNRWLCVAMPTGQNREAGLLPGLEDLPADGRQRGAAAQQTHTKPDFLTAADLLSSLFYLLYRHNGGCLDNKQTPKRLSPEANVSVGC